MSRTGTPTAGSKGKQADAISYSTTFQARAFALHARDPARGALDHRSKKQNH
jgi:hypothetical protein